MCAGPCSGPWRYTRNTHQAKTLLSQAAHIPAGKGRHQTNKYLVLHQLVDNAKKKNKQAKEIENGKEFFDKMSLE